MASSLFSSNYRPKLRSRLYRAAGWIISASAVVMLLLQIVLAQRAHRVAPDKGPRAMGLIELAANGKAHLIPITIMVNGEFYDASEYKASPVPMSLDTGIVYEAVKTGVSQGLFTVRGATAGTKTWRGEGTWESEAEIKGEESKKKAAEALAKLARKKPSLDEGGGPPVLRRAGAAKSPDKAAADKSGSDGSKATKPVAVPTGSASPTESAPSASTAKAADVPSPSSSSDEDDPDRPQLRRSKVPRETSEKKTIEAPATAASHSDKTKSSVRSTVEPAEGIQLIPAISDAGGPEPRSYEFNMNPDEERQFRNQIMAMAAAEVTARVSSLKSEIPAAPPVHHTAARRGKPAKAQGPTFQDVQFRVFDLSNSNEAVVVFTAKAQMPASKANNAESLPGNYFITLVAREDIYGELHKALSNVTDDQHLDVLARLDLIDAVDVDGDGRGELLFRKVSDTLSGYVVYRVIGNQLWPLFQGAIG
ncbi:MAG TPA: hypothetical protein VGN39_02065 [Terriglobales bacterium]|nr:hypothetical protein [Terriglobales bacterium]